MSRVRFSDGWQDDIERQVNKAIQAACDTVFRRYEGHPVDRVKDALRREFKRHGMDLTDPHLTQFAEAISAGTRIRVRAA